MPLILSTIIVISFLIFLNNYFEISGYGVYGSSSSGTYSANAAFQSQSGYTKELSSHGRITFKISGQDHSIRLQQVTRTSAIITVESEPVNITLDVGDEAKLNLTGADYYDFYVKLASISFSRAKFTIRQINESIPQATAYILTVTSKDGEDKSFQAAEAPSEALGEALPADFSNFWTRPSTLWTLGIVAAIIIGLIVIIANANRKLGVSGRKRKRR